MPTIITRYVSEARWKIEAGISLLMLLARMLILARDFSPQISSGISPESLFISSDRVCKFFRFPIPGGILPVIRLLVTKKRPSASPEISGGSSPEK